MINYVRGASAVRKTFDGKWYDGLVAEYDTDDHAYPFLVRSRQVSNKNMRNRSYGKLGVEFYPAHVAEGHVSYV